MTNETPLCEIFIFPLNTVLFPDGVLPLKIFEQRYLDMTKSCLRDNAPFGVCLIREGEEVGTPAVPEKVGCLAVISDWEMPQPGLFHLITRGTQRFRILETRIARNGLISANVGMLAASDATPVDPTCREVLKFIIGRVGQAQFPAPLKLDDADWVSYRLAEVLPIDMARKQRFLETESAAQRITELHSILREQGLVSQGTL